MSEYTVRQLPVRSVTGPYGFHIGARDRGGEEKRFTIIKQHGTGGYAEQHEVCWHLNNERDGNLYVPVDELGNPFPKMSHDTLEEESNLLDTLIIGMKTIAADDIHSWELKQHITYFSKVLGPKTYLLDLGHENLMKINAWLNKPSEALIPDSAWVQSVYRFADILEVGVYGGVNALLITLE